MRRCLLRFETSFLEIASVNWVVLLIDRSDDPFKLCCVYSWSAIKGKGEVVFRLIIILNIGLIGDAEEIGISASSVYGIEGGKFGVADSFVNFDWDWFIDSLALAFFEGFDSFASFVLSAGLGEHNKIIIKIRIIVEL